ncbi:MAG: hypothetical protein MZV70_28665 [Desulfobacterales bacterium]|nr:hypothetical protein [Desulfobacterales bacterium]
MPTGRSFQTLGADAGAQHRTVQRIRRENVTGDDPGVGPGFHARSSFCEALRGGGRP